MYKVTNKLNQKIKYKDIYFGPGESKEMEKAPTSDFFIIEKIEKKQLNKGGENNGDGLME